MFQLATRRAIGLSLLLTASIVFQTVPMIGTAAAFARNRKDASPKRQPQPSSESVARQPLVASNGSLPLPAAPNITATKVDAWDDTATPDGKAEPGQTITYSATISNTGSADATGVTFTDSVDANTTLVPGSITTQPIAAPDSYNVIGNVRIQVPDGASDLLANDCDPDPAGGPCTNTGLTVTTLAGDSTAPFAGLSTAGGSVTATTGDGSFQYNPAPGFAGQDTFTYTVTDGTGKTDTATVTLQVGNGTSTPGTNVIWFVDPAAAPGGDGRLTSPFNCYTGGTASCFSQTAADDPGDAIFLFAGSITGGYALLANQKLVGAGASDTLANIAGLTVPTASDALPTTNGTPSGVTITTTNVNAIPLPAGAGNTPLLRGFTVGNVGTGTKISGNTFGTLTVGNNTTPDVTLNGTGQALNLNTGTLAATSAFTGVTTTSSSTSGLNLTAVSGTLALGSTAVSGNNNECMVISNSAANLSFGNTSCTGGGNGVSISGAAGGTRTFGTLSVSGGTGNAYTQSGGGGNVTANGAATLSSGAPDTIVIQNANGNTINFAGGATVNHTGTGGNGIQWSGTNSGSTLTFATLALTTSNGTGMNLSGGGTVNVTTAAGSSISATGVGAQTAPAILANGIALNANLTTTSCNGSGTGGNCVNLTTVTGTSNLGGGTLTGAAGATFLVSGGTASVTYGGGITQGNNAAMVSVAGGHNGTLTFNTGTLSATNGTGLQFDNADGTYAFNGTNTLNGGDAGIDILNGSSGTFTFSASSTITSPSGTAFNVASSPGNPNVTYSGSITDNTAGQRTVNIDGTTGGSISIATVTAASTAGGVGNTGVNINNANGNVTFTTLNLGTSGTRQTAQALTITGGSSSATYSLGTFSIFTTGVKGLVATNADGTLNDTSGTVDSSSATAIDIDGPAGLTTLGMSLTSVNSAGGTADGISLQDTNGTFTVNGDGTNTSVGGNATGGTISNKSGADGNNAQGIGVFLNNVSNITLRRLTINGTNQGFGIRGNLVNNFTLEYSTVNGTNGTNPALAPPEGAGEGAVYFGNTTTTGMTGVGVITNCIISGGRSRNFSLINSSGTLNRLTVTGTTFGLNQNFVDAQRSFSVEGRPSAAGTILNTTVTGSTFTGSPGDVVNFTGQEPSIGTSVAMDVIFQNNAMSNNHAFNNISGGGMKIADFAGMTFNVSNNSFRDASGSAITLQLGAPVGGSTIATNLSGTINNNTIGVNGVANSGSKSGNGIFCSFADNTTAPKGQVTIAITNNIIREYKGNAAIFADNTGGNYDVNATITGNTGVSAAAPGPFAGLALTAGGPTPANDDIDVCANITGNDFSAGDPANANDIIVGGGSQGLSTMRLPGLVPSGTEPARQAQVQNFIKGNNNVAGTQVTAYVDAPATFASTFIGGAACTLPTTGPTQASTNPTTITPQFLRALHQSETTRRASSGESRLQPNEPNLTDTEASTKRANSETLSQTHLELAKESSDESGVSAQHVRIFKPAIGRLKADIRDAKLETRNSKLGTSAGEVRGQRSEFSKAGIRSQEPGIRKAEVRHQTSDIRSQKSDIRHQTSEVRLNHAKTTRAVTPVFGAGGTVSVNIGTLAPGDSVTITFQVTIDNPYSGGPNVSNQGTVSGSNFSNVLTDDPAVGGAADPTLTPINVAPDVSISNAKVAEPTSGTTPMLFTVALSAPAAGTITVTYNTADGSAVAPGDYNAAVNQTVVFAAGEQLKIIPIIVNSDADGAEGDETFTVTISVPPGQGNVVGATGTGTITAANPAGTLLVSELRTSGPGGSADEFVEIYNNTDTPHVVAATNGSTGYGVFKMGASCNATPILVGTIPNGTTIPARGHYLLVGSAYSLADYGGSGAAAGNLTMTSDIENDRNVSIFSTTNILALSTTTRFDAVGFGTNTGNVCDLQREGTNLGNLLGSTLQYSFFRTMTKTSNGNPKDTNDNAADFLFADTAGTLVAGAGQHLGAPGPENLASPIRRDTSGILLPLLDGSVSSASAPNRFRDLTPAPPTASQGTMEVRRRVQNTTGATVTRLRFRIVDITTFPSPGAGTADLRVLTSSAIVISGINDPATCASTGTPATVPCQVTAQVTTLETPPAQANGGGYNSTVTVTLPGPGLANNASIDVNFKLGVVTTGNFRFLIIVEALP